METVRARRVEEMMGGDVDGKTAILFLERHIVT